MREILLILSMLLLWLFSAKAFWAYVPTDQDTQLLIELEQKVDYLAQTNPTKLKIIWNKLSILLPSLDTNHQARYILHELFLYIQKAETAPLHHSPELIRLLVDQFG